MRETSLILLALMLAGLVVTGLALSIHPSYQSPES